MAFLLLLSGPAFAHESGKPGSSAQKAAPPHNKGRTTGKKLKPYPFDFCFISNDKLDEFDKPVVFAYQGQELKVCCRECKSDFEKNPTDSMKRFEKRLRKKGRE